MRKTRHKHTMEGNIPIGLKETEIEDWLPRDQNRGRWPTFMNTVMKFQFHERQVISSLDSQRRTLFHGLWFNFS